MCGYLIVLVDVEYVVVFKSKSAYINKTTDANYSVYCGYVFPLILQVLGCSVLRTKHTVRIQTLRTK